MTETEVSTWARSFWRRVGREESFPRDLELSVSWAFPVAIVKLSRLTVLRLRVWLADRGISFECGTRERPLRGGLFAKKGHGLVFLDGTDAADEQRFSLSHELVHFVRHYLEPRERMLALLGEAAREILDGHRTPTSEERLQGLFAGVPFDTLTHLMDRSEAGTLKRSDVLTIEDEADRLALELLAPQATVVERLDDDGVDWQSISAVPQAVALLVSGFGLPAGPAESYGRWTVVRRQGTRTFRDWIGA